MVVGSAVLVSGAPTYTWEAGSAPNAVMASRDAQLAAYITPDGVTLIEKPIDVAVGDVRVAALDDSRWAALFSEVGPDSLPLAKQDRGAWYAEYDGEHRTLLEPVPLPVVGDLAFSASSALVRAGDRLAWIAVVRLPEHRASVLSYERRDGEWRSREVSDAWAETTALAYGPSSGLWLALVSEDPDLPGWQKSLRLYRHTSSWELVSRVWVAEAGTEIYEPRVTVLPGGVTVTWRSVGREALFALARVEIRPGSAGRELMLDENAAQVVPLEMADGVPTWIVDHVNPITQQIELRLVRATPRSASVVLTVPSPYTGFFGAVSTAPYEVFVAGPEFNPDPARPTVRSLILRLSTSCT